MKKQADILARFDSGDYPVTWERKGKKHYIIYGEQTTEFDSSARCVDVAHEFGECVRHSLECAGKL